tara:strand:- start:23 stop:244 length:222 start_codon:yes stop_codon:yes gene_type:complete
MKELLVVIALMNSGAVEDGAKERAVESVIGSEPIITEMVHINTSNLAGGHELKCWTANIHSSDGTMKTKVQCQ